MCTERVLPFIPSISISFLIVPNIIVKSKNLGTRLLPFFKQNSEKFWKLKKYLNRYWGSCWSNWTWTKVGLDFALPSFPPVAFISTSKVAAQINKQRPRLPSVESNPFGRKEWKLTIWNTKKNLALVIIHFDRYIVFTLRYLFDTYLYHNEEDNKTFHPANFTNEPFKMTRIFVALFATWPQ